MEVAKWIVLIAIIALAIWLVVDTTIFAVKKIKEKKKKQLEKKDVNNDETKSS